MMYVFFWFCLYFNIKIKFIIKEGRLIKREWISWNNYVYYINYVNSYNYFNI